MTDLKAIQHCVFYENEAIDMYCKVLRHKNFEIGLVQYDMFNVFDYHNDMAYVSSQISGLCYDGYTPNLINVIENKCPYRRKLNLAKYLLIIIQITNEYTYFDCSVQ